MYAVGRLIGRSICTVSGPFTPFGGAVDIVVVEQQDGSFKSSPWYVRFGKFQGVLKTREKVVSICVNGVEMDFHMYLDHTGEAYFLEEVEEILLDTSCVNELNKQSELAKSLSCDVDGDGSLLARSESESSATSVTGSKRSRLLGLVWGRKSSQDESGHEINRVTSLDRAEIVADLLDVNWSTELATGKTKPCISSQLSECTNSNDEFEANEDIQAVTNVASLSAGDSFVQEPFALVAQVSENFVQLQSGYAGGNEQRQETLNLNSVVEDLETNSLHKLTSGSVEDFVETPQVRQMDGSILDSEIELKESDERYYSQQSSGVSSSAVDDIMHHEQMATIEGSHGNVSVEDVGLKKCANMSASLDFILQSETDQSIIGEGHEDEQFIFSDDELKPDEDRKTSLSASSSVENEMDTLTSVDHKHLSLSHTSLTFMEAGHHEDAQKNFEDMLEREQEKTFFPIDINEFQDANTDFSERMVESLPNLWSHIDSLEADHQPRHSFDASTTSPRWLNQRGNILSLNKPDSNIEAELDMSHLTVTNDDPSPKTAPKPDSVSSGVGDPSKTIVVPSGTWRLWPFAFQRTTSRSTAPFVNPSVKVADSVDVCHPTNIVSETNCTKPEVEHNVIKKKMRTITPTSPQLASLGLKNGGNSITFTFSTAMLGKQQVNARIYLWKWNSRIVISDVDGTITRSDVLGQFMPMVGYDWNHIGVAPLFSAIKENGYQLLFLSARSISQSYLTRQFLFNLKQNGKSLPDGPVVISPDGLFPSLFREVIRRAPHEFKIACLEDIKALFPPNVSPFYAGFGNRDTDEISYLRVGIQESKIFIINPKGEVAIHRRVDTNSYSDLHSLVDGLFPVVSSSEPEAFNSWNFWKLPPRLDYEI